MFKINPTNIQPNNTNYMINKDASFKPVKFRGASFEPIRPEHFQVKIDDTVVFKQRIGTEPTVRPKDTGFISTMYDKLITALADNSEKYIEIEEDNFPAYEYKVWYYA